ncbi:MAG TPA: PEP/pyruvate-binding domain-containing protein [Steroidobacteraceae bacterium]|nr:PEP/pyruvate-binding domain-containing protein [Steroidobacteraceae bacterium]
MSYVSAFAEVGIDDRPHVGGKGGSLGELLRANIAVPPGFIVRTLAFERFLETVESEWPVRSRIASLRAGDLSAVSACCEAVRRRLEEAPLPLELAEQIERAYAQLCGAEGAPLAVRSSATTEDAVDASFAGLQDTYLWVPDLEQTLRKVRSCWASLYSLESVSYRRERNFPEQGVAMAVVVQAMVDARTAGVMFTRSPTTGDRSVITIEAAWGLGSAVVGGEVTPDRWVLGKITGEITVREISDKAIRHAPAAGGGIEAVPVEEALRRAPSLSDAELQTLRSIARKVERHYGSPQDIEWAVDRSSGEVLLLQSRPETVWGSKERSLIASAAENPITHVMSIFGGRK